MSQKTAKSDFKECFFQVLNVFKVFIAQRTLGPKLRSKKDIRLRKVQKSFQGLVAILPVTSFSIN